MKSSDKRLALFDLKVQIKLTLDLSTCFLIWLIHLNKSPTDHWQPINLLFIKRSHILKCGGYRWNPSKLKSRQMLDDAVQHNHVWSNQWVNHINRVLLYNNILDKSRLHNNSPEPMETKWKGAMGEDVGIPCSSLLHDSLLNKNRHLVEQSQYSLTKLPGWQFILHSLQLHLKFIRLGESRSPAVLSRAAPQHFLTMVTWLESPLAVSGELRPCCGSLGGIGDPQHWGCCYDWDYFGSTGTCRFTCWQARAMWQLPERATGIFSSAHECSPVRIGMYAS